jgi:hypothetical protein
VLYHLISSVKKPVIHDRPTEQDIQARSPETARRSEPEELPDTPGLSEKEDLVAPRITHSEGLAEELSEALKQETDVVHPELEFPAYTPEEDIPVEPSPSIIDEYTFTGWFDHITDSSRSISSEADREADPKSQQNLIDRFLEEQPDITADPDAEADQTDRAESYTRLGDSLMTESLAKIYLEQGLRKNAILVYEKLSLKYPEKSTYFASQINRIKNELKEN